VDREAEGQLHTVEDAAGVRARLLQDFGDAELVTEALGGRA